MRSLEEHVRVCVCARVCVHVWEHDWVLLQMWVNLKHKSIKKGFYVLLNAKVVCQRSYLLINCKVAN